MGFFKTIKDSFNSAREQLQNLDEVQQQMKQKLGEVQQFVMEQQASVKQKVEEQLSMNSLKLAEANRLEQNEDDECDEDEGPRIELGKYEEGVLEIREGITHLDCMSFSEYKHLRKIIFPASLKEIEEQTIEDQEELEELDFSRVTDLKLIPDMMISGSSNIRKLIIPKGVTTVGDCILGDTESEVEVYVPASVNILGSISGSEDNSLRVYLFASGLDIQGTECDVNTFYVLPKDYAEYAEKLKDCESEARLREMPEEVYDVYHISSSRSRNDQKTEPNKESSFSGSESGLFSPRLEALISAALQDGVLTDQERTVILRRAEKEGEDPDEVEMILNARLAEIQGNEVKTPPQASPSNDNNTEQNEVRNNSKEEGTVNTKQEEEVVPNDRTAEIIEQLEKGIAPVEILDISDGVLKGFIYNLNDIIKQEGKYFISSHDYDIKTMTIPDSVRVIKEEAFKGQESLSEIRFSSNSCLEKIEESAFNSCNKLISIDFPKSLKSIGENAFSGCEILESVNIPNSVERIEDYAFISCENLSNINFYETDMGALLTIGAGAFENCSKLKRISLPDTIKEIGDFAFSDCTELETIKLPKTLKKIGDNAFDECALKEIVIPDSVEEIGINAFKKNESLELAVIGKSAKNYYKEGPSYNLNKNAIFLETPNLKTLVFRSEIAEYTGAKTLTKVTFADTVKELGKWAVAENSDLEEIHLPDSVSKIGYGAFIACENLKSIELSDNITVIEEGAFSRTQLREICFPKELRKIGRLCGDFEKLRKLDFSKVTKLETIPEGFIGDNTPKLRELVLPMGVKNIEEYIGGENLNRLFLPPTIEEVEDLHQINLDIYCYAPIIEELGLMIESIEDAENACTLYVLPEYVESYKAQRLAEGISEDLLIIDVIPEEFRYYYDN